MGLGKAAVFAGILAGTAFSCPGLVRSAAAQDAVPETRSPALAPPLAPVLGRERITAELLNLEPAGEPTINEITAKNDVILSAPFRLREEGRLASDIATETYRMAAGAPVVHREFKQRGTDQSEAIQAWCGPGETRTMFGWSGGMTVCMVHTSDGKANLGSPQLNLGPWWMSTNVAFANPNARTERVAVEPVESPSVFRLIFIYERLRSDGVALHAAIEGPGMGVEARPYRYDLPRRTLPLSDGATELVYDGLRLTLVPQRRGDVVAASSERVAAPFDLNALRARAEAEKAVETTALEESSADTPTTFADTQDVEPTPFVIGGVKLDPASLTVGQGVLTRGGVILSGPAAYAVTARLTKPLTLKAPLLSETSPVGTVLHQVEFPRVSPLGSRTMTRIWCGPIMGPTIWSRERVTMCLRRAPYGGWEAFWPYTGRPWLGTTLLTGNIATLQAQDFEFETSSTSLLEPLSVRAEVQRVTERDVTLRIFARRGDEDAMILAVTPAFENNIATVQFWSHRLMMTRSGKGVVAALSADGDGSAPSDEGVYP